LRSQARPWQRFRIRQLQKSASSLDGGNRPASTTLFEKFSKIAGGAFRFDKAFEGIAAPG
jgi:hypothetical protein